MIATTNKQPATQADCNVYSVGSYASEFDEKTRRLKCKYLRGDDACAHHAFSNTCMQNVYTCV